MKTKMMIVLTLAICCIQNARAQLYYTKNGKISFFSKTRMEDISADNNQVLSVINIQTGEVRFSVLNNAFYFPKAKMQEDFNETYMETDKYPKSIFKGNITNLKDVDFSRDRSYKVSITGDMTIHGVTKMISTSGILIIKNRRLSSNASFKVLLRDYNIKIPTIVVDKIAESIEITVNCNYEQK